MLKAHSFITFHETHSNLRLEIYSFLDSLYVSVVVVVFVLFWFVFAVITYVCFAFLL